jgi:hypothetical protein
LERLKAETPNAVAEQRIRGLLLNNPEYATAFTSGNLARAQAGATEAEAQYKGLINLGADLPKAFEAPFLKNINSTDELKIAAALRSNDPALVTAATGIANPVRGPDMLWRSPTGQILMANPVAGLQVNQAAGSLNPPQVSSPTPMASMTSGQNMSMAPGFGPINPLAGTKPVQPIQPIMPTPAVSAKPAFPATGGQATAPIQNLGGGLTYDPNARTRFMQPLTNFWNGVTGGLSAGMDFLGGAASAVSPAPAVSPDFYDWLEQRPQIQYGIRPDVNFPNSSFKWMNQGR